MAQLWSDHEKILKSKFFIAAEPSEGKEEVHDYELQTILDGFLTSKPARKEFETFPAASEIPIPIPIDNDIFRKQSFNSYQQECISYKSLSPPWSNSNISDSSHDCVFIQQQFIRYSNGCIQMNNPGPMIGNSYNRNYIPREGIIPNYVFSTDGDYASALIDALAKQRPLLEKGKLLQAVTEARLLPITLDFPVPKWRNPPYNTPISGNNPDYASGLIDVMAKQRPLPEKGKILQAVIQTGPLLDTVLSSSVLQAPIPMWQNVPPSTSNFVSAISSTPKRKPMEQDPIEKRKRLYS